MATSSTSARSVLPSSSSSTIRSPSLVRRRSTFSWVRRSHFCAAMSVNRWQIVSSQCVSSAVAADHDRDADAERREDVGELRGDEAAADDHQMLGQLGDPHDGVAGVVGDAAVDDRRRDADARARGDHHLVGGELVAGVGAQACTGRRAGCGPNRVWLAYTVTLGRPRLYSSPPAAIGSMRPKTRDTMSGQRTLSIVRVDAVIALRAGWSRRPRRRRRTSWSGCSRR